jgi:hypothetical protein
MFLTDDTLALPGGLVTDKEAKALKVLPPQPTIGPMMAPLPPNGMTKFPPPKTDAVNGGGSLSSGSLSSGSSSFSSTPSLSSHASLSSSMSNGSLSSHGGSPSPSEPPRRATRTVDMTPAEQWLQLAAENQNPIEWMTSSGIPVLLP